MMRAISQLPWHFRRDFRRDSSERWPRKNNSWSRHSGECRTSGKSFDIPLSTALKKAAGLFPSIAMDSGVLGGTPRIAGTRIPVYMILDAVQHYGTIEGVSKSYSTLNTSQIKDALSFASILMEQPVDNESETFVG
jgi:uncharacterized protein (DUF433 family)